MQMQLALSARRTTLLVASIALLIAGAVVVGNASGAGAKLAPRLALVKGNPVIVAGRGFRAHVRVRLLLVAGTTVSRRPLTNATGAFTVTFPAALDRCSGWSVTAIQSGRAPVILRSPVRPECAPLSTP